MRAISLMLAAMSFAALFPFASWAGEDRGSSNDYASAFERMKELVGRWEGYRHGNEDRKVSFTYRLTGGKAALVEDYYGSGTPGTESGMSTVYHMDGAELRLTHYCGARNQPRMKASSYDAQKGVVHFNFVDVTNLSEPDAYFTREVILSWTGSDSLQIEFKGFDHGKPSDSAYTLARVKD